MEWIACKDKLPPVGQIVLGWVDFPQFMRNEITYWQTPTKLVHLGKDKWANYETREETVATHWMKLPSPPEPPK